tara:strand:+ start:54 stop:392 length:339 start_codon:yes stop_codon:yes gene_type:complete
MSYSLDLRKKVLKYLEKGHSQQEASALFGVSRRTIYTWLNREDLNPSPRKTWQSKINKKQLQNYVLANPDLLLREYALQFNVTVNAISLAFRSLNIRKKNDAIHGKKVYKKD